MNAEILCIGTELVLGDILNTNAQYLSQQLAQKGITIRIVEQEHNTPTY